MEQSIVSRRHILATSSTAVLSGCSNFSPFRSDNVESVSLGSLFVHNPSDEPQTVQLQLRREDEIVYEDSVEAVSGYEIIDPSWSTEVAKYTLVYATEQGVGMSEIPDGFDHVTDSSGCYHILFNFNNLGSSPVELHDSDELEEGDC